MNALHSTFLLVCFCFCLEISVADKKKLQIGVKKKIENCTKRSKKGDVLKMHYTVRSFFSSPLYRYDCLILYSFYSLSQLFGRSNPAGLDKFTLFWYLFLKYFVKKCG